MFALIVAEHWGSDRKQSVDGIGKGPRAGIRAQDARNATALFVDALPARLLAPNYRSFSIGDATNGFTYVYTVKNIQILTRLIGYSD